MHKTSRHNRKNAEAPAGSPTAERWHTWALVVGICLVALLIRLHGIAWDEGHLFHPDERFILQVAGELGVPASWQNAVTPASSLNPFRSGGEVRRFPYGHTTVYLVRVAELLLAPIGRLLVVDEALIGTGRLLAVIADTATVAVTFLLGRRLYSEAAGLLAASTLALTVMHIQQAHFYTADVLLVPVALLVVYILVGLVEMPARDSIGQQSMWAGALFGLAIAIKASAALLFLPLLLSHVMPALERGTSWRNNITRIAESPAWGWFGPSVLCAGAIFALTNPYALIDWQQLMRSLTAEAGMVRGHWITAYTEQYRGTIPYLYPFFQQVRWFLGPTIAMLAWGGTTWSVWRAARRQVTRAEIVVLAWTIPFVVVIGAFFVQFPRYWLPVIPVMVLLGSGRLMERVTSARARLVVAGIVLLPAALYVLAFSTIYTERHPWLQASEWLYENTPAGSTLVVERWDHGLPVQMTVAGRMRSPGEFRYVDVDSFAEPAQLAQALNDADAVVLSSPRIWRVVMQQPAYHPRAAAKYSQLLSGETAFAVTHVWYVEPHVGAIALRSNPFVQAGIEAPAAWQQTSTIPIALSLGPADESFSVYDHPLTIVLTRE